MKYVPVSLLYMCLHLNAHINIFQNPLLMFECEWIGNNSKYFPLLSSGNRFWLFREANLEPGYPLELVDYGQDIPYDRIDTAIWWEPSGYTYLFQGDW